MWLIVIKLNQINILLFEGNQTFIFIPHYQFLEKIYPSQWIPSP